MLYVILINDEILMLYLGGQSEINYRYVHLNCTNSRFWI